jgi:acyl CoA:acetate/3-ketoacid CoA transferase
MCITAAMTVVQARARVELDDISPEAIVTPGIFVQRVAIVANSQFSSKGALMVRPLTRIELVQRIARDIPEGSYVNLGIGIPVLIASHLPAGREIILHSETAFWAWVRHRAMRPSILI